MKLLKNELLKIPEVNNLPIHLISPTGFKSYYDSVQKFLDDKLMDKVYVFNISLFKDLVGTDRYVVAFVSYRENEV